MPLRSLEELDKRLKRGVPPVVLVHSDTPLLREEASARVRGAVLADGEAERHAFRGEESPDFDAIRRELAAPSLFASRRLVELHFGDASPGAEATALLADFAADPAPDAVLLVSAGYQSRAVQRKKWFKAVEGAGVSVGLFPPRREELPGWLAGRLRGHGLSADRDALALLAERVEGNLEAAAAEAEKLALYAGGAAGPLDADTVLAAVGDQARFTAFDLAEAAVAGSPERTRRALAVLRAEGVEPLPVIGALAREVRNLIRLRDRTSRGEDTETVCRDLKIFPPRKTAVQKRARRLQPGEGERVLARLARADDLAKSAGADATWRGLETAALALAGTLPATADAQEGRMSHG
jgi:DNA polymerase-3 subunit delta